MASEKTCEKIKEYKVGDKEERAWGSYEVLSITPLSCTKRIVIKPKHALSLQSHAQRSEQWTVEEGVLTAVIGEELAFGKVGDKNPLEVPVGCLHAMINCSPDKPLIVKEVQSGRCSESDIVRYRDPYGRACFLPPDEQLSMLKSLCLYDAILVFIKD